MRLSFTMLKFRNWSYRQGVNLDGQGLTDIREYGSLRMDEDLSVWVLGFRSLREIIVEHSSTRHG